MSGVLCGFTGQRYQGRQHHGVAGPLDSGITGLVSGIAALRESDQGTGNRKNGTDEETE